MDVDPNNREINSLLNRSSSRLLLILQKLYVVGTLYLLFRDEAMPHFHCSNGNTRKFRTDSEKKLTTTRARNQHLIQAGTCCITDKANYNS